MSLFEDDRYAYRDTFFVLFEKNNRPTSKVIRDSLAQLGNRYQVTDVCESEEGVESFTLKSPYDFSAMDVVYVDGDEVTGQVKDWLEEFRTITLVGDEAEKIKQLKNCDARFDIYHFEQTNNGAPQSEDDHLDPGALLLVIEKLTELSHGTGLDPQSMSLI